MRKRLLVILFILFATAICLAACKPVVNYEGQAKVTFELEGGTYSNCTLPVFHYYNLSEGDSTKIKDMKSLSNGDFERAGYDFAGWFKTKGDNGEYSNEWDFDRDKISAGEQLTLYAKWKKQSKHVYNVCYIDEETNEKVINDSISSSEGATCDPTVLKQKAKRDGYSIVDFLDENGNLWDNSFTHPGGETDLAVDIYVTYVKGEYNVVKQADDLIGSGNFYLARDIDLNGAALNLSSFTVGEFNGNGHTISNFTIAYDPSSLEDDFDGETKNILNISLFGTLRDATVKDVTFKDFSVNVDTTYSRTTKIYVSILAGDVKTSVISNVKAENFEFKYTKLPAGLLTDGKPNEEKIIIVTDRLYYQKDDSTTVTSCIVTPAQAAEY